LGRGEREREWGGIEKELKERGEEQRIQFTVFHKPHNQAIKVVQKCQKPRFFADWSNHI
jgi:hypothetical protein